MRSVDQPAMNKDVSLLSSGEGRSNNLETVDHKQDLRPVDRIHTHILEAQQVEIMGRIPASLTSIEFQH